MTNRRIFIGDVQGCLDPLERLLDRVAFDPAVDRLYFTGDLVNKGPESAGVIRLARSLAAESVLGNHDVYLLDLARGLVPDDGEHTLDRVLRASDRDELIAWLERRPVAIDFGDVFLVHAAVRPTWKDLAQTPRVLRARFDALYGSGRTVLLDDDLRFALTARFTTPGGEQPATDTPPPGPPYVNWCTFYRDRRTVVFGHFARQGLVVRDRIRGLDTGCVYGKELTAWIAEEDRIVSVPA